MHSKKVGETKWKENIAKLKQFHMTTHVMREVETGVNLKLKI